MIVSLLRVTSRNILSNNSAYEGVEMRVYKVEK